MARIQKFRNKECFLGEIKFHSILERTLYLYIKSFLKAHEEYEVYLQYRIQIVPKNSVNRAINYIADYFVCRKKDHELMDKEEMVKNGLILDAKGLITPVFANKRTMLYHVYGATVHMVKTPNDVVVLLRKYIGERSEDKSV
ncbi:MAG: hypothetical protein ACRCX2_22290 [Paraclostridium sp.]